MGFKNVEFDAVRELERQRLAEYDGFFEEAGCRLCGGSLDERARDGVCLHCLAEETETFIREAAEREIALFPDEDGIIFAMECLCFLVDNTDFSEVIAEYLA